MWNLSVWNVSMWNVSMWNVSVWNVSVWNVSMWNLSVWNLSVWNLSMIYDSIDSKVFEKHKQSFFLKTCHYIKTMKSLNYIFFSFGSLLGAVIKTQSIDWLNKIWMKLSGSKSWIFSKQFDFPPKLFCQACLISSNVLITQDLVKVNIKKGLRFDKSMYTFQIRWSTIDYSKADNLVYRMDRHVIDNTNHLVTNYNWSNTS